MSLLSVRNLTVVTPVAGGVRLLDDVSFDVEAGGYTIIVGQNGAGKSTLLKCITRIQPQWRGEILLDGRSILTLSRKQAARRIALVPQAATCDFAFTVRQTVEMGRFPYQRPFSGISPADETVVCGVLEEMGISHLAARMVHTLSGGERQKVFLAAALAQEPELLLLDEPTTYLDYRHQADIGRLLRKINRDHNVTILEVTHEVNRAVLDGWHVVALTSGQVAFDGSPAVFMQPETLKHIFGIDFQLVEHPSLPLKMIVPGV